MDTYQEQRDGATPSGGREASDRGVTSVTSGPNSAAITHGIRVEAAGQLIESRSHPEQNRWLYAYRMRIANVGEVPQRLVSRHWVITDANGERREVRGEGIVGEQPRLDAGDVHEYRSMCDLPTAWGTMEGSYRFVTDEGDERDVTIGRFFLVASSENAIVVE